MSKVVLNTIRLLSADELCSVALAKRLVILDPELATKIGIASAASQNESTAHLQSTWAADYANSTERDLVIGRTICCTLLQRAIRIKPKPNTTLIKTLLYVLNKNKLAFKLPQEGPLLPDGIFNSPSLGITKTLSSLAALNNHLPRESSYNSAGHELDVTVDELKVLTRGQNEIFASVCINGLLLKTLANQSDCNMGLLCEALTVGTDCFTVPQIQRLPNNDLETRHLVWLTEDSKLIDRKDQSKNYELQSMLATCILPNGEIRSLASAMIKVASEMFGAICGDTLPCESQYISDKAWAACLQSHIDSLCFCLQAVLGAYRGMLPTVYTRYEQILRQLTDNQGCKVAAKGALDTLKKIETDIFTKLDSVQSESPSMLKVENLSVLLGDILLFTSAISLNIISTRAADAKKAKPQLGHGNLLFYNFLKEILGESVDLKGAELYEKLQELLKGHKVLHFRQHLDEILLPKNQAKRVKVPKGTIDILPDAMLIRSVAISKIKEIFRQHGALEIDTPIFELRETLLGKYGDDQKLIFDLKDHGGEQLSLRYDLTVPFARFLASNKIGKMKRFHIAKVYRRDEPQLAHGRYREFVQCDLDFAGEYERMVPDAEVIFIFVRILRCFQRGKFLVKISHRGILDAILFHVGVPVESARTICSSIDKLDKEPWEKVRDEMVNDKGLPLPVADAISTFVTVKGNFETIRKVIDENKVENCSEAVEDLRLLYEYLRAFGVDDSEFIIDLSLARGLDYYTGIIFEAVILDEAVGSVGAGGRYDGLIGSLSGRDTPAIGMSVGIERILKTLHLDAISPHITDVFVCTIGGRELFQERLKICGQLWENGIRAEFHYGTTSNFRKQLDAAFDKGTSLVVIVGSNEMSSKTYKVKSLSYGSGAVSNEVTIPQDELVDYINKELQQNGNKQDRLMAKMFSK